MGAPKGNCFNPKGRPEAEIDFRQFEELCGLWCTIGEIAAFLKVDDDTLKKHACRHYGEKDFSEIYKRFFNSGIPSFRRERRIMAATNPTMSIWLGKIHLGEKDPDKQEAKHSHVNISVTADPNLTTGLNFQAEGLPDENNPSS